MCVAAAIGSFGSGRGTHFSTLIYETPGITVGRSLFVSADLIAVIFYVDRGIHGSPTRGSGRPLFKVLTFTDSVVCPPPWA